MVGGPEELSLKKQAMAQSGGRLPAGWAPALVSAALKLPSSDHFPAVTQLGAHTARGTRWGGVYSLLSIPPTPLQRQGAEHLLHPLGPPIPSTPLLIPCLRVEQVPAAATGHTLK